MTEEESQTLKHPLLDGAQPGQEALTAMKTRGGQWSAYQNHMLDSADLGHLRFLKVGASCTFEAPPQRYPDTPSTIGWKYLYVGMVNLETEQIE